MTVVRTIQVPNRLARLITMPGGKKVAEAIASAEKGLAEIADDCIKVIDERLASMAALAHTEGPAAGPAIYDQANELISLAFMLELKDMGRGAYSLCELIDRSEGQTGSDPRALLVHVESLKLLRHPERLGEGGGKVILDGLEKLLNHKRGGTAAA
jgi:hypothetical protein